MKNLNRGQIIGVGKANIVWPGLSAPIIRGRELVKQEQLPPDTEREAKLMKMRDDMVGRKSRRLHPLERGWSGAKMAGRSIGPPDPIEDGTYVQLCKVCEGRWTQTLLAQSLAPIWAYDPLCAVLTV